MKIIDFKVNPSTVGMTTSSAERQVLILAYNVTLTYEDGSKKRKTVSVDTPMLPKSSFKGYGFGASFFIIVHQDAYYVFSPFFEFMNKIPLSEGRLIGMGEDLFGLRQGNMLIECNNKGLIVNKRELTDEEIHSLDSK